MSDRVGRLALMSWSHQRKTWVHTPRPCLRSHRYIAAAGPAAVEGDAAEIAAAAIEARRWADVTVMVIGDSIGTTAGFGLESCGEMADRTSLDPPGSQLAMLEHVAAAGAPAPLVVVTLNGRPATFGAASQNAVLRNVSALLVAWRPGQEGGLAVADVLLGRVDPSGRLTQAWVQSAGHIRSPANPWMQDFPANGVPQKDNYDSTTAPLFPFGFGLSFTTFNLSAARCGGTARDAPSGARDAPSGARDAPSGTLSCNITVTNSGYRDGALAVQVYAQRPMTRGVSRLQRQLAGFEKVWVAAGASVRASIPINVQDLARYDPDARVWVVDAGTWQFWVSTCAGSAWGGWNAGKDRAQWGCDSVAAPGSTLRGVQF